MKHRIFQKLSLCRNQITDFHKHKAKPILLGFEIHTYTLNVEETLSLADRTAASRSKDESSAAGSEAAAYAFQSASSDDDVLSRSLLGPPVNHDCAVFCISVYCVTANRGKIRRGYTPKAGRFFTTAAADICE